MYVIKKCNRPTKMYVFLGGGFFLFSIFSETWRVRSTACLHQTFSRYGSTLNADRKDVVVVLFLWKEPPYLSSFSIIITKTPTVLKREWQRIITEKYPMRTSRKLRSSILCLFFFSLNVKLLSTHLKVQGLFCSHHNQQAALVSLRLCETSCWSLEWKIYQQR